LSPPTITMTILHQTQLLQLTITNPSITIPSLSLPLLLPPGPHTHPRRPTSYTHPCCRAPMAFLTTANLPDTLPVVLPCPTHWRPLHPGPAHHHLPPSHPPMYARLTGAGGGGAQPLQAPQAQHGAARPGRLRALPGQCALPHAGELEEGSGGVGGGGWQVALF
jgi:hypothetical protein